MSSLLLRWLNDELKLHRKVEVLERDASSGYLVAEVLHRQGLEPQLEAYEDSSSMAAKIHNMELLGERLEALGLPFPVSTRRSVMMEDRSAVLQFLLQLKDFLRRRAKGSPESAKAKVVALEEPVKAAASAAKSANPPRDAEERFVAAATQKFHPQEVRFHKGVDMAVHLRKFEQAQWQAENELADFHEQAKADKSASSAAGYAAARAHLQEKAQFMRAWDHEHLNKWQHTQRLYLAAERDDLRLELTLEARRQIYAEAKLAGSQQEAASGVVEFEKNMSRLGLAFGGAEQALRAIPATDAGALAHLRSLESRVQDLDFRPSSNVKMMKELRKRRKAQLAAEKDRRMRRQKALAEQKKAIEAQETPDDNQLHSSDEDKESQAAGAGGGPVVDPRGKYLEDKRAELEENYARLRESGSAKREEAMKVLGELRLAKREKERRRAWGVCSEAVDGLVSLAMAVVSSSDRDTLDIEPLKQQLFLQVAPFQPARSDQGGQEQRHELDTSIHNFLSCSEVWAALPLQSRLSACDVKSDVEALADRWAGPPEALDTTWRRPPSFVLLSVFTEDESGADVARQVSTEHHLAFLQLEPLVEECVKMGYDPQKLGDQVATLSDRERELGAFGSKIAGLRQKNTAIPDVMAAEIVAKAISLYRREALAAGPHRDASNAAVGGCMLHNFPRTLDEAKLLEKAILADLPSEESGPSTATSQEGIPEEAVAPAVVSAWDCVVSISSDQPLPTEQPDADKTLQASDSGSALVDKPRPSSSKMLPAESQRKLAIDEEQRARNEEQRAMLGAYWGQTTRHIQIKRFGLPRAVLAEAIHLCIDVYTQTSYQAIGAVIECRLGALPEQVEEERQRRRESMSLVDRVMWMKASKEVELESNTLTELVEKLQELNESLYQKLREPMATIRSVVQAVSALAVTAEKDLESELFSGTDPFQVLLDQAATKLQNVDAASSQQRRERILTELEVALGDMADFNRVAGNDFVDAFAQDPFPEALSAVDLVYQLLPSICLSLKDHAMRKLELLRAELYDRIPFLREPLHEAGRKVVLSKTLTREAMGAATDLGGDKAGGGELAQLAGEHVLTILSQVASEYSFHLADEPPAQQYALSEASVTADEIARLLQLVALVCRFADRLRQSVGQLYASDLRRLQQTVRQDIHTKDKAIADAMAEIRLQGHAVWPTRDLELSMMSGVASRLPRKQQESFLTIPQLGALVRACENWERVDPSAAGASGGSAIASEVFVALVLEVAAKEAFPARWKEASAVAAVTLQQGSTRGSVSWRKVVWTLLCIQFAGLPSLEDIAAYAERALTLPAVKRQLGSNDILLSRSEFWPLPLWFEEHSSYDADELKELVFLLFAAAPGAAYNKPTAQLALLPMLLCWCAHPSCSFGVQRELEEFTPRYSRGLFRVFRLLRQHSTISQEQCMSSLFTLCGVSSDLQLSASSSFTAFSQALPADVQRFLLLQNPLEALVQP